MHFSANIFDVWVFRRRGAEMEFLLLYTSVEKVTRYFNGGRFWQIPSNFVKDGESITEAISRVLDRYGLRPKAIWAGEHARQGTVPLCCPERMTIGRSDLEPGRYLKTYCPIR